MYKKLEETKLKDGSAVEVGVVLVPDERWGSKISPFLGHKGPEWIYHVKLAVAGKTDRLENRFYLVRHGDELVSNIMTVEHQGVGILGHVWTPPEHRRKGACSAIMKVLMDDFRRRRGKILVLGTGFDTPPYHIYAGFGFVGLAAGSGLMDYKTSPDAYEKYYAPGAVKVVGPTWEVWPRLDVLAGLAAPAVKSVAYGLFGVATYEQAYILIKQELEAGRCPAPAFLESETGAIVGAATVLGDARWGGGTWVLDLVMHPKFVKEAGTLAQAVKLPEGRVTAYTTADQAEVQAALAKIGLAVEGTLRKQLAAGGRTHDVVVMGRA